jgi:DNA-binding response OmpR family regulator
MTRTILCAEDERGIRQYLQQELLAAGYNVILTVDGIESLEALSSSQVDLVIIDEHMPRCNGLEAARHIRLLDPTLPIILFTGDQHFEQYRGPHIDAVIIKSEDLTELKAEVASLLHNGLEAATECTCQRAGRSFSD